MSESGKGETVAFMLSERVSAIVRTADQQLASDAMRAAVEGGFRLVEFTLTTPGALELVTEFSENERLVVGAGTVMSVELARAAVSAGARFLVSPIVDESVIAEAASLGVPVIPGAYTPTEMETAHRLGADFVKVFPAPAGGVAFIESVLAPLPHLRLFPTNGVKPHEVVHYLNAGCAGVGFAKPLFDSTDMANRDYAALRERAADIIKRVSEWRSSR